MFSKKDRRTGTAINAGSMADIAFLLLIFFLVTTTILMDEGILVKLPPWDVNQEPIITNADNVLKVLINADNKLLVEGEITEVLQLKGKAKEFISNPNHDPNLPSSPTKAIISLQNDRSTAYETYLGVYNELRSAYNELWHEKARAVYGKSYEGLAGWQQREIRKQVPLIISEAEPSNFRELAGE